MVDKKFIDGCDISTTTIFKKKAIREAREEAMKWNYYQV